MYAEKYTQHYPDHINSTFSPLYGMGQEIGSINDYSIVFRPGAILCVNMKKKDLMSDVMKNKSMCRLI